MIGTKFLHMGGQAQTGLTLIDPEDPGIGRWGMNMTPESPACKENVRSVQSHLNTVVDPWANLCHYLGVPTW